METALFVALERPIDGCNARMDGKRLAQKMEDLDAAAEELGVRPLSQFLSTDAAQMTDFAEEGAEVELARLPEIQQFNAEDGLASIRALASHPASQTDGVADDLQACERILSAAAEHGVRWHLGIDAA